jgi:endonuclease/exonuclease/phosphatase family metal-dependent hydrolase
LSGSSTGSSFTVMSYNIRLGVGSHRDTRKLYDLAWGANLPEIINKFEIIDPDIIGFQEIASLSQSRIDAIALNIKYPYKGSEISRSNRGWWGVAVLLMFYILSSIGVEINFKRGDQRTIIISTLKIWR